MKTLFAIAVITSFVLLPLPVPAVDQSPVTGGTPAPGLPTGVIVMWGGALDAIPAGWALCDGSDGTPDLRNRFVLGGSTAEYLGSSGGSRSHQHRNRGHTHQIDPPALRLNPVYGYSSYGGRGTTRRGYYMFTGQTFDMRPFKSGSVTAAVPGSVQHLPPYYKIAFIMKR